MSNDYKLYRYGWLLLLLSLSMGLLVAKAQEPVPVAFGEAEISVGDIRLVVEYAYNFDQRQRGLMYRESLCENCGMLFKFDRPRYAGFWMKNTQVPLDIAYIDALNRIVDIKPMYPFELEPVASSAPVLYALEMNQGWFAANHISVGDSIAIKRTEFAQ
ncbi:DUF192 domain-containing protein [Alteromonas sp. ASW11-36]|uniref:DUF192 domain-containing protein n=1 Tax=Alteromonas arenosi TaxID=3055817 RepID=A0ABT7T007_9ALTE|nr:DUF192 domain-containing protein [Alteromonas sp. ASW11-36]MDM7861772.1 DUF192 domain-containing protein [Alteromonas sp. ASW11-36]